MNEPKDRYTAVITGFVAALIVLAVAFGAPISTEQKAAVLGFVGPAVAIVQAIITRFTTTDNAVVVAKAEGTQAVAADASVYPNGAPLETVPTNTSEIVQRELLSGRLAPEAVQVK